MTLDTIICPVCKTPVPIYRLFRLGDTPAERGGSLRTGPAHFCAHGCKGDHRAVLERMEEKE